MIFRQVENFFPRLDLILPEIRKIKLYSEDEYNKFYDTKESWPGLRSKNLIEENIFLYDYVNYLLTTKKLMTKGSYKITSNIHLRLQDDNKKDWIHKDKCDLAALIYLSDTNFNSGTYLYDDNGSIINDIKFLQNRCILYSAQYSHKGYGHHGINVHDGRLTLNLFLNEN
jgi:hypothetical protein|tara:strand:- start:654 stop:1163 length:510 start_codon:yes stop_codon:yes gene_type:complete